MPPTGPPVWGAVPHPAAHQVTVYSQRDPKWGRVRLANGPYTIAQMGCLLTCLASCLTDALDERVTPPELNKWLLAHDGYEPKNSWIKFGAVNPLGLRKVQVANCMGHTAPLEHLARASDAGLYVILFVDTPPGGKIASHWVRLTNRPKWIIMDPAPMPSEAFHSLEDYTAPGWTLAEAVKAYVLYEKA